MVWESGVIKGLFLLLGLGSLLMWFATLWTIGSGHFYTWAPLGAAVASFILMRFKCSGRPCVRPVAGAVLIAVITAISGVLQLDQAETFFGVTNFILAAAALSVSAIVALHLPVDEQSPSEEAASVASVPAAEARSDEYSPGWPLFAIGEETPPDELTADKRAS